MQFGSLLGNKGYNKQSQYSKKKVFSDRTSFWY